jgi:hypothetical protein
MKAVLFFCVLVFLNFAVMRSVSGSGSLLSCGKEQERNALQNLLGKGTEKTQLVVSSDCFKMFSTRSAIKKNGKTLGEQIIPKDSCRVGLDNDENTYINVISKSESDNEDFKECPSNGQDDRQFQAFFLTYELNMNTFMFLDPNRARWFFTSSLTGCDIFVAINKNNPNNPLVIHSNMNAIENNKDNLEHKGNTVDKIMETVPVGYELKARVYHKSQHPDARKYMDTYRNEHPHIEIIMFYNAESQGSPFLFFGYYSNAVWHFFIKAKNGGETYKVLPEK